MVVDNEHPYYPYSEIYPENCLEEKDFVKYSKQYLSLCHKNVYKGELSEEDYVNSELEGFLENLYCSMILSATHWGVWAILLLKDDTVNDQVFNYQF
mmetsp:Transcript_20657/g.23907  ORF Transcript_20657/g.23907 Transcript_20657/m.23907 type:complete len:97 (-) Transcript_20657:165-455(-)